MAYEKDGKAFPAVKESVPAKYNRLTALEFTVEEGRKNVADFAIESGGKLIKDGCVVEAGAPRRSLRANSRRRGETMNNRARQVDHRSAPSVTAIDVGLLERLFDLAPDIAFFVKDAKGLYLAVNESLLNRHGLKKKEDAIGKRPSEICPGDFGQVPADQDIKVLRTGRPVVNHLEMQWHRPHQPVWCMTTKLPIRTPDGQIIGLIGFSRDIRVPVESYEIPKEFAAALDYFELHLNELDSPSMLAQRSNMTLPRMARLTKRLFGLTPSQLITKTRVAAASRMLLETQKPILDIALASGFYDQSAFTRTFRAATGVTPSEFRKQSLPLG